MKERDELTKNLLNNILASMEGGVFTVDKDISITSFNRAAEKITGYKKEEVLNKKCFNVFKSNLCGDQCRLKKAMVTGKTTVFHDAAITNKAGDKIPVSITTSPLRSEDNKIIGGLEIFRDVSKYIGPLKFFLSLTIIRNSWLSGNSG